MRKKRNESGADDEFLEITPGESLEAVDAVPGPADDLDDERQGRPAINLDDPLTLTDALKDLPPVSAPAAEPNPSPAPVVPDAAAARELESVRTELARANENYLRALADLQNFRRRSEENSRREIQGGNERVIKALLPILDDFELAVSAARETESYDKLIGGVEAIFRKFQDVIAKQGVAPIPAVGTPFDPDHHEAVMLDEETEEPDNTVTAELRKGYMMNDRVIRPSLVKVAKSG